MTEGAPVWTLAPILTRLGIDAAMQCDSMRNIKRNLRSAAGTPQVRRALPADMLVLPARGGPVIPQKNE